LLKFLLSTGGGTMREISPRKPVHFLLMLIVFAYAGVLVLAPIYAIIDGALVNGFEPVRATFEDKQVQHALGLSVKLALAATAFNGIFGLAVAWVLERQDFLGRRLANALVDIPFVFSPVIAGYTLIVLFGRHGWITPPFAIVFALPGMFLSKAFVALPFVTREVGPVLGAMRQEQEEAAYTLGASRWRTFWQIVFPVIWVAVLYGVVLTFARAVGEFGAIAVVSGAIEGKTETATMFVFRALLDRNRIGAYSVSLALGAFAIILLILMAGINALLVRQRERASNVDQTR
jgi:sulfate/thiosulfate transport system permease protein